MYIVGDVGENLVRKCEGMEALDPPGATTLLTDGSCPDRAQRGFGKKGFSSKASRTAISDRREGGREPKESYEAFENIHLALS
eukprot:1192551-Prorocentrum_minimum.AAC.6